MQDLTRFCLDSDRLRLQSISLDYAQDICTEFTAEITEFMFPQPINTVRDAERFINDAEQRSKRGISLTAVILKPPTLEFLGVCGIHRLHTETPEIDIWLKKSAHGHGYGREAVHCLKNWLDRTLDYEYLVYTVDRQNIPSRKIPESLGGKVVRGYEKLSLSGRLLDLIEYRIYRL